MKKGLKLFLLLTAFFSYGFYTKTAILKDTALNADFLYIANVDGNYLKDIYIGDKKYKCIKIISS